MWSNGIMKPDKIRPSTTLPLLQKPFRKIKMQHKTRTTQIVEFWKEKNSNLESWILNLHYYIEYNYITLCLLELKLKPFRHGLKFNNIFHFKTSGRVKRSSYLPLSDWPTPMSRLQFLYRKQEHDDPGKGLPDFSISLTKLESIIYKIPYYTSTGL